MEDKSSVWADEFVFGLQPSAMKKDQVKARQKSQLLGWQDR